MNGTGGCGGDDVSVAKAEALNVGRRVRDEKGPMHAPR
jgi:hypothetical protein